MEWYRVKQQREEWYTDFKADAKQRRLIEKQIRMKLKTELRKELDKV